MTPESKEFVEIAEPFAERYREAGAIYPDGEDLRIIFAGIEFKVKPAKGTRSIDRVMGDIEKERRRLIAGEAIAAAPSTKKETDDFAASL